MCNITCVCIRCKWTEKKHNTVNIVEEQVNAIDNYRETYHVYVDWCSAICDYTLSELASDHDDKWNIHTLQYRVEANGECIQ